MIFNFSDWLYLEVFDIMTANTSGVDVLLVRNGAVSEFKIDDETYQVTMVKAYNQMFNKDVYSITFTGPGQSVLPTNRNQQFKVYKQMLLSLKVMLKQVQPAAITFYGATPGMDLIYDDMVKKYLADAPGKPDYYVFYPIDGETFISKATYNSLSPEEQERVNVGQSERQDYLAHKNAKRQQERNARAAFKELEGTVFRSHEDPNEFYVITKADPRWGKLAIMGRHPYVDEVWYDYFTDTSPAGIVETIERSKRCKKIDIHQLDRSQALELTLSILRLGGDDISMKAVMYFQKYARGQ